jgi:Protein of unknown function (DUF1569)
MKSLWHAAARRHLIERLGRIDDETRPRWGTMSAAAMVAHLAQSIRMAIGEIPVATKKVPLRFFPLKQIGVYLAPFPKGLPTAPELLARSADPLDQSRREVERLLALFVSRGASAPWAPHPVFGSLTARAWGVLGYRHFDHHLRQFGV